VFPGIGFSGPLAPEPRRASLWLRCWSSSVWPLELPTLAGFSEFGQAFVKALA